ncbi:amino acid adenylation domain-containing protein [Aquimarina sp. AD10]|uniref:amino acid adenylation domain-containing protein n=1 Tax=Aquimarina sp. AD10 TaxID=1714849 RepID=UPI000E5539EA|nr:amino acid adenylation domain-containing protein [Aquimarina sp. AD10]AXT59939.1 amino acid adenylation domain-containing protein [Aquimarina sp. AD10]RKM95658.1 amino acid adenylation domain-containing protein [Aquimarina sp. AD10]
MNLLLDIQEAIEKNDTQNAFYFGDTFYTYKEFAQVISNIRKGIQDHISENDSTVGLITNDDIETYASIIALWLEGKAYVPLNPEFPESRNHTVIKQAEINSILDSSTDKVFDQFKTIQSNTLDIAEINLTPRQIGPNELAYIFFTSGTTGTPKGVPITFGNLSGFIDAFWDLGYEITNKDRCLQMFELTFDLSVMSYLGPILKGACIYTIPKDEIKYSYIFELMEDHELTFALMVPSILHYLRPYFDEINCPAMKFSLFCGEALPLDVTQEWSQCIPNATIANVYGPTECTIFCTDYTYKRDSENKTYNGVLTIGKDMKNTTTIIVDEDNNEVGIGEKGELCLSGAQLTPGYWKNEEKNKEVFFDKEHEGKKVRFYRTGDLCTVDDQGDILYLGRVDFQAKIQGFRVELSEIEFHAKAVLDKKNSVAVAFINSIHNTEIGLVIESTAFDTKQLIEDLKNRLPQYMIPTQIRFIDSFPLNTNGKTDRKKLKEMFN